MKLVGIEVPQEEIDQKLSEYEAAMDKDERYKDIGRVYRALNDGKKVISLVDTIRRGGFLADGLPILGIARRAAKTVQVEYGQYGSLKFTYTFNDGTKDIERHISLANGTSVPGFSTRTAKATVPVVPPGAGPSQSEDELTHFVLFEATWRVTEQPRDPALLRGLGGDFYEVVSTWDLTDVEARALG